MLSSEARRRAPSTLSWCATPRAYWFRTVRRMVMWNQSSTCSASGVTNSVSTRTSSPPSVRKVTSWFACRPWLFSTSEQPAFGFLIVAMYQAEVAWRPVFWHRAADDQLEVARPVVPVTNVAAIKSSHDAAFRDGQLRPVGRTAIDEAGPLVAQLGFRTFRNPQGMLPHGGPVRAGRDRQHVGQQPGCGSVGHER